MSPECPPEEVLARFAAGTLLETERSALEGHLARCSVCFEVVSALVAGSSSAARGTASASSAPVLARGTALGRYLVLEPLGVGGMGVVYSAYDPGLDRKVALKLLPPQGPHGASSPEGRLRLQREARALARLSHPNVVTVYDVGSEGEQVFVAMELVDGQTLGAWLSSGAHDWRQVVRCFAEAGRGLASAHAVGLVHRDFKPDNVLIGHEGRVRVTDFGLARVTEDTHAPREPVATAGAEGVTRTGSQVSRLSGALSGTPRYMAPEQWQGEATGPWTDQFSFCVALWEALHGEPPFAGTTPSALGQEVLAGRLRPMPTQRQVPARLHAALVRGLQREPSARHPSMEALLAQLEVDPARRRRRVAALVGTGVVLMGVLGVGLAQWTYRSAQLCAGGPARVQSAWGAATREGVRRGLLASGVPSAERTWELLTRSVDAYTFDWASMHRESCEATRVRGEQSEQLLDRRMLCLDHALQRVSALARELEHADRATAGKAMDAVHALPALSECANAAVLLEAPGLPRDASAQRQVLTLREQLAELETLKELGHLKEALPRAEALSQASEALAYPPLQAEALLLEGTLLRMSEQMPEAIEHFRRAALRAEAGREDTLATQAWARLALIQGTDQKEFAEARRSLEYAQAKLDRLGRRDRLLEAEVLGARSGLADREGNFAEAVALDRERVETLEQQLGPDAPALASALHGLAASLYMHGQLDEASASIHRALTLRERHWGPETQNLAVGLNLLAIIAKHRHQLPEAREAYERALRIYSSLGMEQSSQYAQALANLASLLDDLGEHAQALAAFQRAVTLERTSRERDSDSLANVLTNMSSVYRSLGRFEEALAVGLEALSLRTTRFGPRHVLVGVTLDAVGLSLMKLGRYTEALEHFRRELEIFSATFSAEHPHVATAHYQLGLALAALERNAQARASLERALAIFARNPNLGPEQAETRFRLALLQWKNGGPDRARVREQILELRERLQEPARTEVDAWLRDHPGTP
ncbi:serine/threonine-protein kinase [Hyalangium rubrum]|uniref:Serine/threonine-protein kinase n=1 Tax=Hyalangium rubrum TaxID=3103134 RepID=A0ABU5H3U3_9BACT|nr:serine/threonine-protein kinase [Hyalangium sp. s54d21]MDY7228030.1 serine/threonine-protein kinase [Hyalangium sp. s54d21]